MSKRIRGTRPLHAGIAAVMLAAAPAWSDSTVVYSTDFFTAYYSSLDLTPPYLPDVDVASTCADAAVRVDGDRVYILGRFGCDYVQTVDPSQGFGTVSQWSTGNGTNPQDIEIITPQKAYVSLYERTFVLVMNPQTGEHTGQIDLSMFNDADGSPEMADMVRVGDRVYVALQRLDRPGGFIAANPSYIAVIDSGTDQVIDVDPQASGTQAIVLSGRNPFGELTWDPVRQKICVPQTGDFGVQDGGVEYVDPIAWQAEGFFIDEATLGGDLNTARLWVDCNAYAIITDAQFNTRLVRFDRCAGSLVGPCHVGSGFTLADVEITADGRLLLADRNPSAPGMRVYSVPGCELQTPVPVAFGLPPQDIAIVGRRHDSPSSTMPLPALRSRLQPNRPDPFNPVTTLTLQAPAGAAARLEVFDVNGRRVGVLWEGTTPDGPIDVVWNARDASGRVLPSGVYFARLRTPTASVLETMTLVR
jgi:hypothetical protein